MSLRLPHISYITVALLTSLLIVGYLPKAIPAQILPFGVNCPNEENPDCNWDIAYQFECDFSVDTNAVTGNALVMTAKKGVGYVVQDVPADQFAGLQVATLMADVSTSELTGKGAGLTITVLGADSLSMQYAQISDGELLAGTTSGTLSIQVVVPQNAASIRSGLIAYGPGAATFSNVRLEVVEIAASTPSPLAKKYINAVIDTIAQHSLMRDSVNIEALREKGYQITGNADTPEEAWLAVRYLLEELKDHHSFFMSNPERKVGAGEDDTGEEQTIKYSTGSKLDDFGYLNIPGFHANIGHLKESFADSLRSIINRLQTEDINGWIVDLRGNDGGNMYPDACRARAFV